MFSFSLLSQSQLILNCLRLLQIMICGSDELGFLHSVTIVLCCKIGAKCSLVKQLLFLIRPRWECSYMINTWFFFNFGAVEINIFSLRCFCERLSKSLVFLIWHKCAFPFPDISKHYSQKASLEQDVPTATQKLITTNDCILSSVAALTNGAGKVMNIFVSYDALTCAGF